MGISASVGMHSGKQCYNVLRDQQTITDLLNLISRVAGRQGRRTTCAQQMGSRLAQFASGNSRFPALESPFGRRPHRPQWIGDQVDGETHRRISVGRAEHVRGRSRN